MEIRVSLNEVLRSYKKYLESKTGQEFTSTKFYTVDEHDRMTEVIPRILHETVQDVVFK
jgi:hypothetical protein